MTEAFLRDALRRESGAEVGDDVPYVSLVDVGAQVAQRAWGALAASGVGAVDAGEIAGRMGAFGVW